MRSGLLTAISLALAGVGMAQWAIVWFLRGGTALTDAILVLAAAIGLAIAAFGFYTDPEGRPVATAVGLAVAAAAGVGRIVAYAAHGQIDASYGALAVYGSTLGLLVAAFGARKGAETLTLARAGLAIACVAGILWIVQDATSSGDRAFLFGDVMTPLGWGLAALFAGRPEAEA